MKFIPVALFERINSLIQGVEAQGCLLTIRLEAFTCRITKEERHVAANLAQHQQKVLYSNSAGGTATTTTTAASLGSSSVPGISPILLSAPPYGTMGGASLSPLLQPTAVKSAPGALFPSIDFLPPAAAVGSAPAESGTAGQGYYGADLASSSTGHNNAADGVDDRLVFLVSALNAIHGDGYDFSVLSESDFELLEPHYVKSEIENMLASLPEVCYPASGIPYHHDVFWQAIADVLCPTTSATTSSGSGGGGVASAGLHNAQRYATGEDESGTSTHGGAHRHVFPANPPGGAAPSSSSVEQMFSTCDFFLFKCPSCDPIAQRTVWSNHVFVYAKRQKVMVSILCFGEGNLYRGDDGVSLTSLWRGSAGGGGGARGLYGEGGRIAGGRGHSGMGSGGGGGGNGGGGASEEYYYDEQRERLVVFQSPASYDDQQSQPSTDGEWEGFTIESKNRDFYGY